MIRKRKLTTEDIAQIRATHAEEQTTAASMPAGAVVGTCHYLESCTRNTCKKYGITVDELFDIIMNDNYEQ